MTLAFLSPRQLARTLLRLSPAVGMSLAALAFLQCSSSEEGDGAEVVPPSDGDDGDYELDSSQLDLGGLGGGEGETSVGLHPLCGGTGSCLPDDEEACMSEAEAAGAGGAGGGPGELLGGAAGGVAYDPGELAEVGASCRVGPDPQCDEGTFCGVVSSCQESGGSEEGEPCVAAADCRASLACVGEGVSGVCRSYCCEGTERSCSVGTFCDERPLLESPEIYVPVCLPVDYCALTEPFPCPEEQDCSCEGDRACIVVRPDGATACTEPGTGQLGDPCTGAETAECAHGFVCSPSAGCMKLCSTVAESSECPEGGTCQSPSEFPTDLGVCVGAESGSPVTR